MKTTRSLLHFPAQELTAAHAFQALISDSKRQVRTKADATSGSFNRLHVLARQQNELLENSIFALLGAAGLAGIALAFV